MKNRPIPALVMKTGAFLALIALCVYLYPLVESNAKFHFQLGKPWTYELITAAYDFPIYKTEEQLSKEQTKALQDFTPYFTMISEASSNHHLYVISLQDKSILEEQQRKHIAIVQGKRVHQIVSTQQLYTPKSAYMQLGYEVIPNLKLDSAMTAHMQQSILSNIALTEGMVQAGEKIIDRGEIVTDETYRMLTSYIRAEDERHAPSQQLGLTRLGVGLMSAMIIGLFIVYLIVFRRSLWEDVRAVLLFCMLCGIMVLASYLAMRSKNAVFILSLIPFTWVPITARVFYDSRTAMMLHLTTIALVAMATPVPYQFLMVQLVAGSITIACLKDMSQRAQLATTAGLVLVGMSAIYTCILLVTNGSLRMCSGYTYLAYGINALLIICVYGVIYLIEKLFRLVSSLTLVELTNINSNLMLDFAEKAPGTFQHSLQVSNLATEAAKKIGAKVLLVRTGAMYHDIGKMLHPQYFTENQADGINPLLTMSYRDAAQTVIRHITDGEQLARKRHLPEAVIHFITTHHGTSLVRYFYNCEVNAHPNEEVQEADFRYPGPKPTTKESAILMMADAIEARSRSLKDFAPDTVRNMVNEMIEAQVLDGQFSQTPLSFRDVEQIKQVFTQRLLVINHRRVQYPTLNNH